MRIDPRRQLQEYVERHGIQQNMRNCPATVIAAASLCEPWVRDITANAFADLHLAESATWQEGVKEYFQ